MWRCDVAKRLNLDSHCVGSHTEATLSGSCQRELSGLAISVMVAAACLLAPWEASAQTAEATAAFIAAKIQSEHAPVCFLHPESTTPRKIRRIFTIRFDPATKILTEETPRVDVAGNYALWETRIEVPFDGLNIASIRVEIKKDDCGTVASSVRMDCVVAGCITHSAPRQSEEHHLSTIGWPFEDQTLADRMASAFRHLAKISGSKAVDEPF